MMKCPISKKPCKEPKYIILTEIHDDTIREIELCPNCIDSFISIRPKDIPPPKEKISSASEKQQVTFLSKEPVEQNRISSL